VAWLRIGSAALIFAAWRRPWRIWSRLDHRFVPVIALAALATRTRRNLVALAAAVTGVYLLTDVRLVAEPVGIGFAIANAALFSLYIILGHRVAQSQAVQGIDGLALAMLIAAVVALPIGATGATPAFTDPIALAAGVGVGVSSSVVSYVGDQFAMARLKRATYALMVSLLPATATVIGVIVLTQIPHRHRASRRRPRHWRRCRAPKRPLTEPSGRAAGWSCTCVGWNGGGPQSSMLAG
jgi:inner membrane transporter RhtA